jgi:hypothetical protein
MGLASFNRMRAEKKAKEEAEKKKQTEAKKKKSTAKE